MRRASRVALVRAVLDGGPRHADDGELRGHEERVRQQKPERDERDRHDACALHSEKRARARPEC